MDQSHEKSRVEKLYETLEVYAESPEYKRLRVRLRELGDNQTDEVSQFRLLQRAWRESASMAETLSKIGVPELLGVDLRQPTAEIGEWIQIFNSMIERYWRDT